MRVGYWLAEKKLANFFRAVVREAEERGVTCVLLDPHRPVGEQGAFDVVVHKLTPHMPCAGSPVEHMLRAYVIAHPEVRCIDPPAAVMRVHQRHHMLSCVDRMVLENGRLAPLPWAEWSPTCGQSLSERVAAAGLSFPLVYKPVQADDHACALVYSEEGLAALPPCALVLQQFVAHEGVIFKGYVIADHVWVRHRPSLVNDAAVRSARHDPFFFGRVSNARTHAAAGTPPPRVDAAAAWAGREAWVPRQRGMEAVAGAIRRETGLSVFNFDVVVCARTGTWHVIDVNYFPGYFGIADAPARMLAHVLGE